MSFLKRFDIALIILLHSGMIWSLGFKNMFGIDLNWVWHHGIAEQGILFGYLQPSIFGVFLLLGLAFLYTERTVEFILSITIAGTFHANYIVLGGIIFFTYALIKPKLVLQYLKWFILPSIIWGIYIWYSINNFTSNTPEFISASEHFIKNNRHLDSFSWINVSSFLQFSVMLAGLYLVQKTDFGKYLCLLFVLTILLSFITLISQNVFLINLSPWRISIIIMPVCVVLIIRQISNLKISKLFLVLGLTLLLASIYFKFFGNTTDEYMIKWRIGTSILFLIILLAIFFKPHFNWTVIFTLIVFIGGVVQYSFEVKEVRLLPESEAESYISKQSNSQCLYLVPLNIRCFTLKTLAPSYIGNTVYFSPLLPYWKDRREFQIAFFRDPSQFSLQDIKHKKITHLLCYKNVPVPPMVWKLEKQFKQIYLYKLND